jgi:8-oxo-dGTP pyrophosphatase MutT (NUDIX family)
MPVPVPDVVSSRELGHFDVFTVVRDELSVPSGGSRPFHRLRLPDWVSIVAVTTDGGFVLVRQYRHGVAGETIEAAGGVVDPGEDPAEAALRELAEETGYAAERAEPLGWIHPNPAMQDNRCHLFLATGARLAGPLACDEHEHTEPVVMAAADLRAALVDGRITHALALVALHRALARLEATP